MKLGMLARHVVAALLSLGILSGEVPAPLATPVVAVNVPPVSRVAQRHIIVGGPDASWIGGKGGLATAAAEKELRSLQLGRTLKGVVGDIGTPWMVVYQGPRSYWMYRTDGGHAWLTLGVQKAHVDSIQASIYAHDTSTLRDRANVLLGGPASQARGARRHRSMSLGDLVIDTQAHDRSISFYAIDRSNRIDRLGRALANEDLAPYARWYEFDGQGPDHPVPVRAYGGTRQGAAAYVARVNEPYLPCYGDNYWRVISQAASSYANVPITALRLRCGNTPLVRRYYLAATKALPRAFDVDPRAARLLGGTMTAQAAPAARPAVTSEQVWLITPNGTRFYPSNNLDLHLGYYDPNNQLETITAIQAPFGETNQAGVASPNSIEFSCSFGSGGGKCTDTYFPDGAPCFFLQATFANQTIDSPLECYGVADDPVNFPASPGISGALGCTGGPCNAVSGNLWYKYQDAQLSGPFGLSVSRRYDSVLTAPAASPTPQYKGDLGNGWIEAYGAYLDLTNIQGSTNYGVVTYHDADGNRLYFQSLGANTKSYDQFSGDTLQTLSNGYQLVTWDNRTFRFNGAGLLTSVSDRIGNTQTINRNGAGQIQTVTDSLGRNLTFSYNAAGQIQSITSGPASGNFSGVNVRFTYGSGSNNCYTGDLCTVTESDNSVWTYEYYNPAQKGNYHLLEYVVDPLGHTEEYDQYQQISLYPVAGSDDHYRVTMQSVDSSGTINAYYYAYSLNTNVAGGTTTITNSNGTTTYGVYTWDESSQEVYSTNGYLCFCRGDSLAYNYDLFGRPLSVTEGGSATPTVAAHYGRDIVGANPDGTTFIEVAYPSITQLEQYGILTSTGFQNKAIQLTYYTIGTARQDLPQTVTEPSVDTAGASAVTTFTFSGAGLPTEISRAGYSGGTQTTHSVSASYDTKGRILTFTGPRTDVNQTTTFMYYSSTSDLALLGQLQYIKDPLGHQTTFASAPSPYNSYTIYGGPKSATDPNDVVTDVIYDLRGRVNQVILNGVSGDPNNLTTTLTYNSVGRLTSTKRPLGNSLTTTFDASNRPTAAAIVDSSGYQREQLALAYNSLSQLTSVSAQSCATPASGCTTWQTAMSQSFAYTSMGSELIGNLSSITDGGGGQTAFAWDGYGNNTGYTAGSSGSYQYSTTNGYDPSHLLTQTQLSGSTNASYTHDLQGNLTRTVSPSTASTSMYFDDFGCMRKEISTYIGTTAQTCDPAGNVTSHTDANGATTSTTYDALNRPLVQTSVRSGESTETVTRTYDNSSTGAFGIGRLASVTDPSGSTTYTYERRGMLAFVGKTINSGSYTTQYTYDGNGNCIGSQLSANGVAPFALAYTYDYADRPYSVSSGSTSYVSGASYEPMGPRSQLTYGNQTQQTITYDQGYRPVEAKVTNNSTSLSDLSYTFNSAGYLTQVTDNLNGGYDESFAYGGKATNMLTAAKTGASLWGTATYSDTSSQNLLNANFPSRNLTYGYDRVFQLLSINQTGSGITSITHDAAGNETDVGAASYSYSPRELLSSGDGISYTYDGSRQRAVAQSTAGTREYVYDRNLHLQAESSLSSTGLSYEYVWFGGTPVAQVDIGGSTHWTAVDQRGAPFMQTTSNGSLYWQADYEPFGAVHDERTSDVHQPLRLPGQEAEQFTTGQGPNGASGRYYNAFRWYRPNFGRYTQPDPLGFTQSTYNIYGYAQNNPYNYVDPLGLAECAPWQGPTSLFSAILISIAIGVLLFPGADIGILLAFAAQGIVDFGLSAIASSALLGSIATLAAILADESGEIETGSAVPIAETGAEGALASFVQGPYSTLANATSASSKFTNFSLNVSATDFINNLIANGYNISEESTEADGSVTTVLSNELSNYAVYVRDSTEYWGAHYVGPWGQLKFLLNGP